MTEAEIQHIYEPKFNGLGYDTEINHAFVDLAASGSPVTRVPVVAFAGYPPSYRNACLAVVISQGAEPTADLVARHRALGAPIVFVIKGNQVEPWSLGTNSVKSFGKVAPADSPHWVAEWSDWVLKTLGWARRVPWYHRGAQSLGQFRLYEYPFPAQLSYLDLDLTLRLRDRIQKGLEEGLRICLKEVRAIFHQEHGRDPEPAPLHAFLFRFVLAKIYQERVEKEEWKALNLPLEILRAAENEAGLSNQPAAPFLSDPILTTAWRMISENLHFQNLDVPEAACMIESIFSSFEIGNKLDSQVRFAPWYLAEFLLRQLPWPGSKIQVVDPFCGGGQLLAKALACMLEPLVTKHQSAWTTISAKKLSDLALDCFIGADESASSLEICRMLLTLVNYPHGKTGQGLHHASAWHWPLLEETLQKSKAVLTFPPHGAFTEEEKKQIGARYRSKPAEILCRILQHPPDLLGMMLPGAFLTHPTYREAHLQIRQCYENIKLLEVPNLPSFPEGLVALAACEKRSPNPNCAITFAQVLPAQWEAFRTDFQTSPARTFRPALSTSLNGALSLKPPSPSQCFSGLKTDLLLDYVAEIHPGLRWLPREWRTPKSARRSEVAYEMEQAPGTEFRAGAASMMGNLFQFQLRKIRMLSMRDNDHDPKSLARELPWKERKTVCNVASFLPGSPWRLAAWADASGLVVTKRFFAIWPERGISEFALAAILSSPFANAFVGARDGWRRNTRETLYALPLPKYGRLLVDGKLHLMAKELQDFLAPENEAKRLSRDLHIREVIDAALRLDAAVLDAYELTASQQQELLAPFSNWKRPLPPPYNHCFPEYFPKSYGGEMTLNEYLESEGIP